MHCTTVLGGYSKYCNALLVAEPSLNTVVPYLVLLQEDTVPKVVELEIAYPPKAWSSRLTRFARNFPFVPKPNVVDPFLQVMMQDRLAVLSKILQVKDELFTWVKRLTVRSYSAFRSVGLRLLHLNKVKYSRVIHLRSAGWKILKSLL